MLLSLIPLFLPHHTSILSRHPVGFAFPVNLERDHILPLLLLPPGVNDDCFSPSFTVGYLSPCFCSFLCCGLSSIRPSEWVFKNVSGHHIPQVKTKIAQSPEGYPWSCLPSVWLISPPLSPNPHSYLLCLADSSHPSLLAILSVNGPSTFCLCATWNVLPNPDDLASNFRQVSVQILPPCKLPCCLCTQLVSPPPMDHLSVSPQLLPLSDRLLWRAWCLFSTCLLLEVRLFVAGTMFCSLLCFQTPRAVSVSVMFDVTDTWWRMNWIK